MKRGLAQVAAGSNRRQSFRIARIIALDREADLALLSVPTAIPKNIAPLTLAPESCAPETGETVYALGNPEGMVGTISPGIVSAVMRSSQKKARIQITAPISTGSSGGPVVNNRGKVIGVAVGSLSEGQNLNFAIPVSLVHGLLKTASFPDADQNIRDTIANRNGEKTPAPWIQNAVVERALDSNAATNAKNTAQDYYFAGVDCRIEGLLAKRYGNLILANASFAEAIRNFSGAIQLDPQNAEYYDGRARAYDYQGNTAFAIADFNRAIQLDPKEASYYAGRGDAYFNGGKLGLAIADFTKAIQIKPQDASYYWYRGKAYRDQGNLNFAIADFTKAIQIKPQDGTYYGSRGLTYCMQGNKERANEDLKRAFELGRTDVSECR